jgi:hypothetical protein
MAEGSEQVPHPREPLADDNSYRFVQPESAELPDGAEVTRTAVVTRDDAARLSALLELAERHGPLPLPRAAVAEFVRITGTDRPTAVFALAGLPEFDEGEQPLRAKPFGARTVAAAGELRALGARLGVEGRQRLSEAALPNELSELWAPDGMLAAARRMAGAWLELVGVPEAPDEQEELLLAVTADLDREFKFHGDWPEFLLGRRAEVPGGPPEALRLRIDRYGGPRLFRGDRVMYSTGPGDRFGLSVLVWLLTECPVGHPAAVRAAELYAELCERRGTAGLLLDLGNHPVPEGIDRAAQFGPGTAPVPAGPEPFWREGIEQPEVYDNGLLLVPSTKGRWHLHVRAAGLTDPALVAATLGRLDGLGMTEPAVLVRQLDVLLGSGPPRMLERAARTPVPVGGYELNPALSVPELTAEAAGVLEVEPDAAALYLQLLALARPTDRNVRTWNGWTPARLRAAQTELAELGLVVRDKRPRAGRTVFLPGPWTELKAPDLPLEARKVGTHLAVVNDRNEASGPFQRLLPPRPPHELFAAAWAAR